MKKISIVILITAVACSRKQDAILPANEKAATGKEEQVCNFGLTHFNTVPRILPGDEETSITQPISLINFPNGVSAPCILLLDFDGHLVSNTSWNYNGNINCSPANLSAAEINEIVQRVSEDYRPFDVVVTTDESIYLESDPIKRMRVIITETWQWYGLAGGISFLNSFTWGNDTPCFVFSILLNYNVKQIAEAVSHEVGHTFGLRHQVAYDGNGVFISEYNYGNGSGELSWAPIMGSGYYRNITLWHRGPTIYGINNIQDDVSMIGAITGFRRDDYTNNINSANHISGSTEGYINSSSDIDFFYIDAANPFSVSVSPANVNPCHQGANLDLVLRIYSREKELIATIDDPLCLGAAGPLLVPGRYYFSVETTTNAYAGRYGQLGKYMLQFSPTTP